MMGTVIAAFFLVVSILIVARAWAANRPHAAILPLMVMMALVYTPGVAESLSAAPAAFPLVPVLMSVMLLEISLLTVAWVSEAKV